MSSAVQDFWDKKAKGYDYSERQFDEVFKEILSLTKSHLTIASKVLDFACATGTKTI
ncbi:MAG: hypothetical protein ACI9O4_002238 [Chitinophagales bacterium]|jgi:hypothetical protein